MRKIRWAAAFLCLILMFAPALSESVPIDDTLRIGDKNERVLELQTRLKALNYYRGPLSGEFGTITQNAVKAVQEAYGMEATGEADTETLDIIFGECYRPLEYGSQGSDVQLLQERLSELGYYSGPVSGNFLNKTKEAVAEFQRDFGMEETGKADVWTLEILYSDIEKPVSTPIPVGAVETEMKYPGKLSYGSTGNSVKALQQRLMDLGFFTYPKTTAGFYRNTQAAVVAFQSFNGLLETGIVDEKTWNAIFNDDTVVASDGIPKPAATPEPVPYHLEVDVNNQVVKVWKYASDTEDYTDLYKCFLCATGTTTYPSAPGTYVLTGRRARWCEFPKWGGGKAQYWVKINDDMAFHSVLYAANDEMSLKVNSLTGLGKRGSHGCVRLTVADARWIYENCREGTVVVIHENGTADPELRAAIQPGALDKSVMLPRTTPAPTVSPVYDGQKLPEGELRNLSENKSGEDVAWLQMKLKEWGYYTGTVTGTYLGGTKNAVKSFQRANGISAEGNVGKATWNVIRALIEAENATPTPIPTPSPVTPMPSATPSPTPAP